MDEGGRRKEVNVSHRKRRKRRKSGVCRKARREGDEPRAQKDAEKQEEENGTKNGVNTWSKSRERSKMAAEEETTRGTTAPRKVSERVKKN